MTSNVPYALIRDIMHMCDAHDATMFQAVGTFTWLMVARAEDGDADDRKFIKEACKMVLEKIAGMEGRS